MSDGIVSFLSKRNVLQEKGSTRRKSFVSVDYSSGSDGDIDSDRETETNKSPVKKLRRSKPLEKKVKNDDDEDSEEENEKPVPGAGWADVMSKIIGRPAVTTTTVVLSKSTAYQKAKDAEKEELIEKKNLMEKKKEVENIGREKPQPVKKDVERRLQRIATRGVVQFFNAVGKQQKLREERLREATTENKRIAAEKSLSKGEFLDMLKTSHTAKKIVPGEHKPVWDVLKDDYMIGAEMKDWEEGPTKQEEEVDEDGESSSGTDGSESED